MRIALPSFRAAAALHLLRRCGYSLDPRQNPREPSLHRRLGGFLYPRLHAYLHEQGDQCIINLHLDQKQPSYAGSAAHAGEYDGPLLEKEAERIRAFFDQEETPGAASSEKG